VPLKGDNFPVTKSCGATLEANVASDPSKDKNSIHQLIGDLEQQAIASEDHLESGSQTVLAKISAF